MKKKLLEYIVDPKTKEPLKLLDAQFDGDDIVSGRLVSGSNSYPIINSIPRFVPKEHYSGSFGYQWKKWPRTQFESENIGGPMEGETRSMFERIIGYESFSLDLKDKVILDLGCGPGRFIDVATSKGAIVIGLDYSLAVDVAKNNFKKNDNVHIIQADALSLPLKESKIDGAYSIGVLHHTPNPELAVKCVYDVLKNNGFFACTVYSKKGHYNRKSVDTLRKFFNRTQPLLKYYPPLVYSYFSVYLLKVMGIHAPSKYRKINRIREFFGAKYHPDIDWAILDTFDSLSPAYASTHESDEVESWFLNANFQKLSKMDWNDATFRGIK